MLLSVWEIIVSGLIALGAIVGIGVALRSRTDLVNKISAAASVGAAAATGLLALFAFGLFSYQRAELFASAKAILSPQVLHVDLRPIPNGQYVFVVLGLTNSSRYVMDQLVVKYQHWGGGSWLGLLNWFDANGPLPPLKVDGPGQRSGAIGSETAVDAVNILDRGGKLYFAVHASWKDPNGRARCSVFFAVIATATSGVAPRAPRIPVPGILGTLPSGLKEPELPACTERTQEEKA